MSLKLIKKGSRWMVKSLKTMLYEEQLREFDLFSPDKEKFGKQKRRRYWLFILNT